MLAGIAQIALIRELSASYALSSVDLSIRLVLATVIASYGLGAGFSPAIGRIGERRALLALGCALALYQLALLVAGLRWLEPQFSASAVDTLQLLVLGAFVAPPFVVCGMVVAHFATVVQRETPHGFGGLVATSLVGTLVGIALSHHYAQWIGVNSLFALTAMCALPIFSDRALLGLALGALVTALPLEGWLERQREARPDFFGPVTLEETQRVYSGWSPYQKVDLYRFKNEILLGCYNGFWQWWVAARTDHPNAFPGYALLYRREWIAGRDVLVIGSGAGMGLLELEASGPRSITAVELDPLVVKLLRDRFAAFNDRIYDRVDVFAMDGRSFLEATDRRYDVIIYEGSFLTAAHPKVAVSAENYLYTVEGLAKALERLHPDGLGIVTYAGSRSAFARVRAAIEANGASVQALRVVASDSLWPDMPALIFGRNADRVQHVFEQVLAGDSGARVERYEFDESGLAPLADARPFLYAEGGSELRPLAWTVASCGGVLLLGLARPTRRRVRTYFFAIGAAFMLVQYGVVSALRSFLGDPVTTAYAVILLMLAGMAIGAARVAAFVSWSRRRQVAFASVALSISVAVLGWLPLGLAFEPLGIRLLVVALAAVPLGVVLGIFFPLGLLAQPSEAVPTAYLYDALGTVTGFMLFYLIALHAGIAAPFWAGVTIYAVAFWVLPGRRWLASGGHN